MAKRKRLVIEKTGRYFGGFPKGTRVITPLGIGSVVGETGYTAGYGTVYAVKVKGKLHEWTGDFLKRKALRKVM